jgi:peptide/nickel transport system ATP-binding protein
VSDHIAVMYAGKIAEYGKARDVFATPHHPYTQSLLAALPGIHHQAKSPLLALEGQVPAIENMPSGCRFANRCRYVAELCHNKAPLAEHISEANTVACHRWKEIRS